MLFRSDERPTTTKRTDTEAEMLEYYRAQEFPAAKQFVQMRKIQDFFLNIEAHFVVVKDLEHQNQVSTFRLRAPSEEFWKIMQRNQKLLEEGESPQAEISVERVPEAIAPVARFYAKDMIGDFKGKTYDIGTMHAIQRLEKRLEKRFQRECDVLPYYQAIKRRSDMTGVLIGFSGRDWTLRGFQMTGSTRRT